MTPSLQIATGVGAGIGFFLLKSLWNYRRLPILPLSTSETTPDLTVIIPARDEVKNIKKAVGSFPGVRVIVVDDHSTDGTAEAARTAGAYIVPAPPLPAEAFGKPNACQAGADASRTPWLLFVDADTTFRPEFAQSIVAYAKEQNLDFVTCFLRQQTRSFFEFVLIPYAFALYFAGVNGGAVNSSASPQALANGQCILARRDAYESLGGHRAVIDSVIEDVALASLAKEKGLKLRVLRAERLGSVRMYESLGAIWRGFQKNSFRFLLVNPWSGVQVILASVLLTSYFPVLLALLVQDEIRGFYAFAALPFVLLLPWYGNPFKALFAPLAIYLFQLIALAGMFTTVFGWKTIWKGRSV